MNDWPLWKKRAEARRLYEDEDWSIAELENIFGCTMTDFWIFPWMIRKRNAYELAKQQREAKNRKLAEAYRIKHERRLALEVKERSRKLRKREAKQVRAMANAISMDNAFARGNNLKQCPINNFNTRSL